MSSKLKLARALISDGLLIREKAQQKSDLHRMMSKMEQAYDILNGLSDVELNREKGKCLTHIGFGLMNMGAYNEAIGICKKAIDMLANTENTTWEQSDCRETLGKCYSHLGQYEEAKKWQLGAIDEFIKARPTQLRKEVVRNLSNNESLQMQRPIQFRSRSVQKEMNGKKIFWMINAAVCSVFIIYIWPSNVSFQWLKYIVVVLIMIGGWSKVNNLY